MTTRRMERVNVLLRKVISDLVLRNLKDPRLSGLFSITEVVCTPDLRHAKVYVSSMGNGEEKAELLGTLNHASGFIRRQLASEISLRRIPELTFCQDEAIEHGYHLLQLMGKLGQEPADPFSS